MNFAQEDVLKILMYFHPNMALSVTTSKMALWERRKRKGVSDTLQSTSTKKAAIVKFIRRN